MHAYIITALRKDMPSMFGKDAKKKELIKHLDTIYDQIQREHQISPGDFPDIKKMKVNLEKLLNFECMLFYACVYFDASECWRTLSYFSNSQLRQRFQRTIFGTVANFIRHAAFVKSQFGF